MIGMRVIGYVRAQPKDPNARKGKWLGREFGQAQEKTFQVNILFIAQTISYKGYNHSWKKLYKRARRSKAYNGLTLMQININNNYWLAAAINNIFLILKLYTKFLIKFKLTSLPTSPSCAFVSQAVFFNSCYCENHYSQHKKVTIIHW